MTDAEFNDEGKNKSGITLRSVEFNSIGKDIPQYKESVNVRAISSISVMII